MNKLKELIDKLYTDGIQYKKLSELCIALKKRTLKTSDLKVNGKYPVINSGRELYGFYDEFNNKNAITFAARGEYAGFISYFEDKFWAGGLCYPYSSKDEKIITNKFLYYYLKSKEKIIMETLVARGSIPALNKTDLDRFMIAVPPLEVQDEIVRILDDFTLLSAELSAELKARKEQYEYYRDKLLKNNKNKVEIKTLDDVCNISAGGDVPKENFSKEKNEKYNIPIISNGIGKNALYGYTDIVKIDKKAVTIAARGTIGYAEYRDYSYYPIIRLISAVSKNENELNTKFLYYSLQGRKYNVQTTGIPQLTVPTFKKEKISIPEIKIQEKIVEVLDNFNKICSDLKIGLPAEIEARQKQYEFYRDTLLTYVATGEIILQDKTRQDKQ